MIISTGKTEFDTSIRKALEEIEPNYESLYGIVITGSHAPTDVELKLELIRMARERNIPLLGICMGMQLMAIEYVRSFLVDANSTEVNPITKNPVIIKMNDLRVGMLDANWRGNITKESFWHHYKFNTSYENLFGMEWSMDYDDRILTCMTLQEHPFFVGTQFHPEYQSSKDTPHALLVNFINSCKHIVA